MENQKLTPEELQQIKDLSLSIDTGYYELGKLNYQKKLINDGLNKVESELNLLKAEELKLSRQLSDKYGEGIINPDTGEITKM